MEAGHPPGTGLTTSVTILTKGCRLKRTLRDASLPVFRLPPVQRRLAGRMSQVAVGYLGSPLTRPGRVRGLPKPGERMPDLVMHTPDGPSTLYAALRGGRYVVVVSRLAANAVDVGPYRDLVDVVTTPLVRRRATGLVRPDGYLAAVETAGGPAAIRSCLKDLAGT